MVWPYDWIWIQRKWGLYDDGQKCPPCGWNSYATNSAWPSAHNRNGKGNLLHTERLFDTPAILAMSSLVLPFWTCTEFCLSPLFLSYWFPQYIFCLSLACAASIGFNFKASSLRWTVLNLMTVFVGQSKIGFSKIEVPKNGRCNYFPVDNIHSNLI